MNGKILVVDDDPVFLEEICTLLGDEQMNVLQAANGGDALAKFDSNYEQYLKTLVQNKVLYEYPPLCGKKGSFSAQYEHTIYLQDGKKVILSSAEDY